MLPLEQVQKEAGVRIAGVPSQGVVRDEQGFVESVNFQGLQMRNVPAEDLVRMAVKAILSYGGYEVAMAEHGAEAVEQYRKASPRFELVVLDMHMPRLDGYGALLQIREIDPNARVVLLSGALQEPSSDGLTDLKGVGFLNKPFENDELLGLVRRMIEQPRVSG